MIRRGRGFATPAGSGDASKAETSPPGGMAARSGSGGGGNGAVDDLMAEERASDRWEDRWRGDDGGAKRESRHDANVRDEGRSGSRRRSPPPPYRRRSRSRSGERLERRPLPPPRRTSRSRSRSGSRMHRERSSGRQRSTSASRRDDAFSRHLRQAEADAWRASTSDPRRRDREIRIRGLPPSATYLLDRHVRSTSDGGGGAGAPQLFVSLQEAEDSLRAALHGWMGFPAESTTLDDDERRLSFTERVERYRSRTPILRILIDPRNQTAAAEMRSLAAAEELLLAASMSAPDHPLQWRGHSLAVSRGSEAAPTTTDREASAMAAAHRRSRSRDGVHEASDLWMSAGIPTLAVSNAKRNAAIVGTHTATSAVDDDVLTALKARMFEGSLNAARATAAALSGHSMTIGIPAGVTTAAPAGSVAASLTAAAAGAVAVPVPGSAAATAPAAAAVDPNNVPLLGLQSGVTSLPQPHGQGGSVVIGPTAAAASGLLGPAGEMNGWRVWLSWSLDAANSPPSCLRRLDGATGNAERHAHPGGA